MFDFKNMQSTASQIEINNMQKTKNVKGKEGVEIFSAIVSGKDLSRYGKKVDSVMAYMKNLGEKAINGSFADQISAKAEINAIREIMISTPLEKRLNLFDFMGNKIQVGFNEEVRYKVYQLQGKKSGEQANSGSFPFPTATFRTETMGTGTITGGMLVDYREYQTGNVDALGVMQEQVITDMMNQMFYKVITALYTGVKNASGIKNFSEAAGITKTAVDNAKNKARRFGNVSIMGDYSVISQMESFAGFTTDVTNGVKLFSEAVMEEIRQTGVLKTYNGTSVIELPNSYDMTRLNADNSFYDTYLPEGLLFFLTNGTYSPLQIGIKGGVQSMTATDIALRAEVQRFDMEFGTAIIDEYIPTIGLVSDSNFTVNKR